MSRRPLASIERDFEIVLESFQAIESLAQHATYEGSAQDISKVMVAINFLMENLIEQVKTSHSSFEDSSLEKVRRLKLHNITQAKVEIQQRVTECEP